MGRTCVDPKCHTGTQSDDSTQRPTLHGFKESWRSIVPFGANLEVTEGTKICSLHFTSDCFQTKRVDKRENRKGDLVYKKLLPGARPTIRF